MSRLPDDIIINIFSRLPVKYLLRFRCVCKPWCILLRDSNLVKMQLNHAIEKNNFSLMLIGQESYGPQFVGRSFYTIDYDLEALVEVDYRFERRRSKDFPFFFPNQRIELLGSCNGLFLLTTGNDVVYLWNPSTQEYKGIPSTPIKSTDGSSAYGFGYDCKIEDYKLVKIVSSRDNEFDGEVMVYTLGSNSWRTIQIFPYEILCGTEPGVLVNGALHWIASARFSLGTPELIVSFDIGDERFQELPQSEYFDLMFNKCVGMLGGCLCVFGKRYVVDWFNRYRDFEVWVMKDYGVGESWTKLFTIAGCQQTPFGPFISLRPMQFFKNGECLLEKDKNALVLYDPKHKTSRTLKILDISEWFQMETYVRSLVSLNSGDSDIAIPPSQPLSASSLIVGSVLVTGIVVYIHVKTIAIDRRLLWHEMEMVSALNMPWLAIGDFNVVFRVEEKRSGRPPLPSVMVDFSDCIHKYVKVLGSCAAIIKSLLKDVLRHSPILGCITCIAVPRPRNSPSRFIFQRI
ncbi:F-box domain [Macleaya cordata]|uniref:F-box domain n=1 Tax=Macleaya cordata TaxID=56857 RepID=A0A200PSP6_MACCD|nr:F-box domain [Macleaya cordata]